MSLLTIFGDGGRRGQPGAGGMLVPVLPLRMVCSAGFTVRRGGEP